MALGNRGTVHAIAGEDADAIADYEAALRCAPADWPQRGHLEQDLNVLRGRKPK